MSFHLSVLSIHARTSHIQYSTSWKSSKLLYRIWKASEALIVCMWLFFFCYFLYLWVEFCVWCIFSKGELTYITLFSSLSMAFGNFASTRWYVLLGIIIGIAVLLLNASASADTVVASKKKKKKKIRHAFHNMQAITIWYSVYSRRSITIVRTCTPHTQHTHQMTI